MYITTQAIVLHTIKYQDTHLIVKCFTQSDGIKSYFIRGIFSTRKKNQKIALFQPLTLLEIQVQHKNKGLEHLKECKIAYPYTTIPLQIQKSTVALFLAEVLHHSIKEEEANPSLFQFIYQSLVIFDQTPQHSTFHLIFLLQLTRYLGFYPSTHQINQSPYFETTEGIFVTQQTPTCLTATQSQDLKQLIQTPITNPDKVFTNSQKHQLLHILIHYYSLHLEGFTPINSLNILNTLFH